MHLGEYCTAPFCLGFRASLIKMECEPAPHLSLYNIQPIIIRPLNPARPYASYCCGHRLHRLQPKCYHNDEDFV